MLRIQHIIGRKETELSKAQCSPDGQFISIQGDSGNTLILSTGSPDLILSDQATYCNSENQRPTLLLSMDQGLVHTLHSRHRFRRVRLGAQNVALFQSIH